MQLTGVDNSSSNFDTGLRNQRYNATSSSSISSHSDQASVSSLDNTAAQQCNQYDHTDVDNPKKPFPCPVCGKCFGRLSHVRRHQLLHTGDKPFQCEVCQERFTRVENRDRHMAIHTKIRPYCCSVCSKGFTQLHRLKVHMMLHTGDHRPIECPTCSKRFKRIDHMKLHMKTHGTRSEQSHGPWNRLLLTNQLNSERKTDDFPPENDCNNETTERSPKLYKCQQCRKTFSRRDHFNRHILVHSGAKPYECEVCSRCFSRKDNKYSHMANCLTRNLGIVVKQARSETLETTIETKMSEIRAQLGVLTSRDDYLHLRISKDQAMMDPLHEEEDDGGFSVEQDDERSLASPDSIGTLRIRALEDLSANVTNDDNTDTNHDRSSEEPVHDDTSYDREDENYDGFNDEDDFVDPSAFLYISDSPEDYSELTEDTNLIPSTHIQSGSSSPRFQCDVCQRNFAHKSHLVRHSMVHTGTKPYRCDQCDKSFNRKEHLQRHVIVHTGIKPFKCSWCDKSFYHLHQQLKHAQEEHSDEAGVEPPAGGETTNSTHTNETIGAFMDSG